MILRAMPAVASSMPDRSKVMIQTKRNTLILQVGGVRGGVDNPTP
jgi:hypothetical protein